MEESPTVIVRTYLRTNSCPEGRLVSSERIPVTNFRSRLNAPAESELDAVLNRRRACAQEFEDFVDLACELDASTDDAANW